MLINDLECFERASHYIKKYSLSDTIDGCMDKYWFKNYPVQNYDYYYNSWGFRGPEYIQHIGKPVNLCLGDSFTVNIGGPIEHSWPSLLQEKYDIPCLNLGMDGAGNDAIRLVYNRACKIFDVKETFVVYSFFHRRLKKCFWQPYEYKFSSQPHDHEENIKHFETNFIDEAHFNFVPPWGWTEEELQYIEKLSEWYIEDLVKDTYWNNDLPRKYCSKEHYDNLKGENWPSYEKFILGADPHPDIYVEPYRVRYLEHCNRDGYHLSLAANQKLADNLYNQTK